MFDAAADGGGEEIEEKKKKKVNVRPHLISIEYVVLLLCAGVVLLLYRYRSGMLPFVHIVIL